jgi:hypothetical protein
MGISKSMVIIVEDAEIKQYVKEQPKLLHEIATEGGYVKPSIVQPPLPPKTITANFEPGDGNVKRVGVGGLKNLGPMRTILTEQQIDEVLKLGFNLAKWPLAMPRDRKLSDSFKDGIRATAQMALSKGVTLNIRPQYHQAGMGFVPDMALIEAHIPQIGELFHEIRPALAYTEAGWLGTWAEWHGDANIRLANGNFHYANARRVFDWINQHYPKDLHRCVRYSRPLVRQPGNPEGWFAWDGPVNEATAYPQNMWGMHNDFYGAGGADASTFFPDRGSNPLSDADRLMHSQQRHYVYKSAQYTYHVGEPDRNPGNFWDSGKPNPVSRQGLIDKIKAEGVSAMNLDGRANMRQWMQAEPVLYQQLLSSLGYNLYTQKVSVTLEGKKLSVKINWGNTGSSGLLNPVKLYLSLGSYIAELSADISKGVARGGQHQEVNYETIVPELGGKFPLGLILADMTGIHLQLNNKGMKYDGLKNDLGMILEV